MRTEGDYLIFATADGSEYRRWAPGNSKGKAPNSLAQRHPSATLKAAEALSKALAKRGQSLTGPLSPSDYMRGLSLVKAEYQANRVEQARLEAEAGLMRAAQATDPKSGKVPARAWGLLVERQAAQALSGEEAHSTKAARFVGETVGYLARGDSAPVQAVQVNVTIGGELSSRYAQSPADGEAELSAEPEGGPILDAVEVEPVLPADPDLE